MNELKCCPFCGGEAEFVKMGISKDIPLGFVRCTECGVRLRQENCTEEFARNEWNRRTPMANIVEKLEEREKYLENAMKESHENGHRFSEEKAMNERVAIRYAINIVKQEINNGLE